MTSSHLPPKPSGRSAIGVKSMHMTNENSETPNGYSFWSACIAMVTFFAIADVLTGGLVRESVVRNQAEYAVTFAFVIATLGVKALESPPGLKFVRACSRHKL